MPTNKTVLVTGSTGFVGSHLVRRLVQKKYTVHILVRNKSNTHRIQDILENITIHECDLLDKKKLFQIISTIQPNVIFHLATGGLYNGEEKSAQEQFETNTIGTVNLLEACRSVSYMCFVNTGSSSEYGKKQFKMKESDSCFPESSYAISKLAATHFCIKEFKTYQKPVVTLRLFSPFGLHDDSRRLIPYIISEGKKNKELNLHDRNAVRDYIYIDDVVSACLSCIKNVKKISGEIINIGSGKQTTIESVVKQILGILHSRSTITWNSERQKRFESGVWQADIRKAKALLQWKPKYSLQNALRQTIKNFYE